MAEQPTPDQSEVAPRPGSAVKGLIAGIVLFWIVFSISDPEAGIGGAHFEPMHLLFAVVIVLLMAILFHRLGRSERRKARVPRAPDAPSGLPESIRLALAVLIVGPFVALGVAILLINLSDDHLLNRSFVVSSTMSIGILVSVILAVVLVVAARLK